MNRESKLILFGGGGHCRSCIDVIRAEGKWQLAGIIDPYLPIGTLIDGVAVLGGEENLAEHCQAATWGLVTVGQLRNADLRIRLWNLLKTSGFQAPVVISPRAWCSPAAQPGEGTILMHGAVVNAGARLGENCIVNTMALIEHDCDIGNHCHISTGARVNGSVRLGGESFVGSGAILVNNIILPGHSFIRAGELVKCSREKEE